MGPPCAAPAVPPPRPPPSPPWPCSKTPLPPSPSPSPRFPLPPPPPFPPGFSPPCFSTAPAPPVLPPPRGLPMPPRHRPPGAAASASVAPAPALAFLSPGGGSRAAKRGRFVEHLVPEGGVATVPVPPAARCCRDVPPELLPPKKRIVRHHPYAAALAIQEMAMAKASHHHDSQGGVAVAAEPTPTTTCDSDQSDDGGLRAELLRLRISRPALVLTKPLTASDRSRDNARLVLPDGLVAPSPLLGMLTPLERRLVFGAGLPVPALDRLGRAYRMSLRRDHRARTYRLTGQWSLFVSRHDMAAGDAVEVRAFRPPAWQARLDKRGEGGLGMALLHLHGRRNDRSSGGRQELGRYQHHHWCSRELDAADGLLRMAAAAAATATA